jgi:hypothetical protein
MYRLSKPEQLFYSSESMGSVETHTERHWGDIWTPEVSMKIWVPDIGHIYICYLS